MARFLMVRTGLIVVTLFVVSLAIFAVTEILPGDAAVMSLRQGATEENLKARRAELGLDRSPVVRYAEWMGGVVRGDLGESLIRKTPITEVIGGRIGNSLILAVFTFAVSVPSAILAGIWAGVKRDSWGDHTMSVGSLVAISLPEFVTGILLMVIFSTTLHWLPSSSFIFPGTNPLTSPSILVLPVLTLTGVLFAYVMRMTRANVIEVMEPYRRRGIYQNVDFFSGTIYYLLGIPDDLFISIFAMGRVPGWTAQVVEQFENNILLRPRLQYTGEMDRTYVPIEERG